MNQNHKPWLRLFGVALILILALAAACAPAPAATPTEATHSDSEGEPADEGEHSDEMIPNDGAVVHIVSPADGDTISGNEIEVKIETENFPLGEDGRHWHVYLDGESIMVMGGDTSYIFHGVAAGEHEIKVTLSNGEHQELEDGATIHVTVSG